MSTKVSNFKQEHVITNKKNLISRVNKLKGQLSGVEKALETDKSCNQILHILASIRGALGGLMSEVMESHMVEHFGSEKGTLTEREIEMIRELVTSVKVFMK